MFLREMFDIMDERYKAQDDASIIRFDDLRKTKLTLEQINQNQKCMLFQKKKPHRLFNIHTFR